MTPKSQAPLTAGRMHDPAFCHYCNKNQLDPDDKYYLQNGIEVCKECASRHGAGTAKRQANRKGPRNVKR